jgi:hypothetical protein
MPHDGFVLPLLLLGVAGWASVQAAKSVFLVVEGANSSKIDQCQSESSQDCKKVSVDLDVISRGKDIEFEGNVFKKGQAEEFPEGSFHTYSVSKQNSKSYNVHVMTS